MKIRNLKSSLLIRLKKADIYILRVLDQTRLSKQEVPLSEKITLEQLLQNIRQYDNAAYQERQELVKPILYRLYVFVSRGSFRLARRASHALRNFV